MRARFNDFASVRKDGATQYHLIPIYISIAYEEGWELFRISVNKSDTIIVNPVMLHKHNCGRIACCSYIAEAQRWLAPHRLPEQRVQKRKAV